MKVITQLSYILSLMFIFAACQKDEDKKIEPVFEFTQTVQADSSAIFPYKPIALQSTQPATWKINSTQFGTIDIDGTYKPSLPIGKLAGAVIITGTSIADTTKKISRRFVISAKADLLNAMQKGGYVLSFRHGNASTGQDQLNLPLSTGWWKSCDFNLARQLDTRPPSGFVQMQFTGRAIRALKLPVGRIISSEYCRCLQSAQELRFTNIVIEQNTAITYYVYDEANRYPNTMKLINNIPINTKNTIISTHAGFPAIPTPQHLNNLNWGDAAIFKSQAQGEAVYVGVITTAEWVAM